jgi:hypothetical protein
LWACKKFWCFFAPIWPIWQIGGNTIYCITKIKNFNEKEKNYVQCN